MRDLVEILRDHSANVLEEISRKTSGKIADEIETLRAELVAERKLKTIYFDEWQDANARERALREALEPFAYYAAHIPDDVSDLAHASGTVGDLRRARDVLSETGKNNGCDEK